MPYSANRSPNSLATASPLVSSLLLPLLRIRRFRVWFVKARIIFFVSFLKRLQTVGSLSAAEGTVGYNLGGLSSTNKRVDHLLAVVAIVEDSGDGKTLLVGCRNEYDIFTAWCHGFKDTIGLDLISYSKWVVPGDMHSIPFPDCTFDTVIVPYTLSYSSDVKQAVRELLRVAKPGATMGIAVEYTSRVKVEPSETEKFIDPGDGYSIRSVSAIVSLLGSSVHSVIVRYDALMAREHSKERLIPNPSPVVVVVQLT